MKIIQEFKEFAIKGNVVDMAVGIIIGDFLFIQSKSAFVYGTAGFISYKSAPAASVKLRAAWAVTPDALKKATNFLDIHTSDIIML